MSERKKFTAIVHRYDGAIERHGLPYTDGKPDDYIDFKNDDGVLRRYVLSPQRPDEADTFDYVLREEETYK